MLVMTIYGIIIIAHDYNWITAMIYMEAITVTGIHYKMIVLLPVVCTKCDHDVSNIYWSELLAS